MLVRSCPWWDFDDDFPVLDESAELIPLVAITGPISIVNTGKTESSVVEIHQTNREKVIAETYWQFVFDEEKQKKM
jgi:hypothetical protein